MAVVGDSFFMKCANSLLRIGGSGGTDDANDSALQSFPTLRSLTLNKCNLLNGNSSLARHMF